MHQERENLDFLFRRISPERVINDLRTRRKFLDQRECPAKEKKGQRRLYQLYQHYAPGNMGEYSADELDLRAEEMVDAIWAEGQAGLFTPLLRYAEKVLRMVDNEPVCKLDEVLNWNSITKRLGQDVFISCWLAWMDRYTAGAADWSFTWPAVIRTDDKALNQLVKRGLAENHFHLHGSTQSFIISWVCLMNHPTRIAGIAKAFKEGLSIGISRGPADNVMPVEKRLWYAVLIRELLCRRCLGRLTSDDAQTCFQEYDQTQNPVEILRHIDVLRASYGVKFSFPGGRMKCVDYANNNLFYRVDEHSANRLLAGERSFLYHCFRMQFKGEFSAFDTVLLHLYLLLKNNFASELIQNNMLHGFHNFVNYQNRKSVAYYGMRDYETEALRLSVRAGIEDNSLVSLEARIMPGRNFKKDITALDRMIQASNLQKKNWEHFYVIHFP